MSALLNRLEALWCSLPEAAQDAMDESALEKLLRCGAYGENSEFKATVWDFMRRIRHLRGFRQMTFAPQRSAEWLELRKNLLTASDLASALGKGKFITRPKLVQSKADARRPASLDLSASSALQTDAASAPKPYKSPALSWGTMFEPMIARIYSELHGDINLYEFGLIRHPTLACFGASPDGITETGKMVEIKCPWKRVIQAGEVPEQYYLQIQGQLSVCQLDHCDYIEVVMDDIPDAVAYYERVPPDATHAHGVIVEYQTADDTLHDRVSYEYSPAKLTPTAAYAWATQWVRDRLSDPSLHVMRLRPWRMTAMNLVPVRYDPDLWNTLVPQIQQFWNEVEEKTNAPPAPPPRVLDETPDVPSVPPKPKVSRPRKTAKYTYRDESAEPAEIAEPVKPSAKPVSAPPKYAYRDDADD